MEILKLGNSGLEVSRLCLGGMSFGDPNKGNYPWTLSLDDSKPIIKLALDKGINFIDTANSYSDGSSEEIIGDVLRDYIGRDNVVLATKIFFSNKTGANSTGLSRKCIFREIDASLKRLKTDYIDLYQIHRWDHSTPIEETLEALHDVVRAGKVRYLGASSMSAWQFAKAIFLQKQNGWTKFISMQGHLNLIYREEEREMLPLCEDQGIGYLAWSPLARGRLARPYGLHSYRIENDAYGSSLYNHAEDHDRTVIDQVGKIAEKYKVSRSEIALAWTFARNKKIFPIIGVTKVDQIRVCAESVLLELSQADLNALESNYSPHRVAGY